MNMKMKKSIILSVSALALSLFAAGCGTTTHYVEASDTTIAVMNPDRMSSSDWYVIVDAAANDMLTSRPFAEFLQDYSADTYKRYTEAALAAMSSSERRNIVKPLLMLSTIRNNTGEHIDTTLLTNRLRETLFNSGKVRFTTYAAGAGQDIDPATGQARTLANDPNVKASTVPAKGKVNAYDLSLAGSIVKQSARDGRMNEVSYMFSLTLTDNVTGEGVWTYTKEIKRQDKKPLFGK